MGLNPSARFSPAKEWAQDEDRPGGHPLLRSICVWSSHHLYILFSLKLCFEILPSIQVLLKCMLIAVSQSLILIYHSIFSYSNDDGHLCFHGLL